MSTRPYTLLPYTTLFPSEIDIYSPAARRLVPAPSRPPGFAGFATPRPGANPSGPDVQRLIVIAADVKLLRAVKAAVDEVRRHIHQQRPFHRIRADKRNIMRAQQVDELRRGEALMPDFHRMPDRGDILRPGPRPSLQPRVMATRERGCGVTVFRQQFQECAKPLGVETHIGDRKSTRMNSSH